VHAQFDRVVDALSEKLPAVADHLELARADSLAFSTFPRRYGGRSGRTTRTPQPRDPPPHRRRRHLPDRGSIIRLVGAVLAKQHDEWAEGRRYLGLDVLTRAQGVTELVEEVIDQPALQARQPDKPRKDHETVTPLHRT
jgi:transposase-like protein